MNHATVVGNLTRDPELRHTANGKSVAQFTVADNRRQSATKKVQFIDVVAWDKLADLVSNYLKKGAQVTVLGHIDIEDWTDKEGNKRRSWKIVAEQVEFPSRPKGDNGNDQPETETEQDASSDSGDDEPPF